MVSLSLAAAKSFNLRFQIPLAYQPTHSPHTTGDCLDGSIWRAFHTHLLDGGGAATPHYSSLTKPIAMRL